MPRNMKIDVNKNNVNKNNQTEKIAGQHDAQQQRAHVGMPSHFRDMPSLFRDFIYMPSSESVQRTRDDDSDSSQRLQRHELTVYEQGDVLGTRWVHEVHELELPVGLYAPPARDEGVCISLETH